MTEIGGARVESAQLEAPTLFAQGRSAGFVKKTSV